MSRSASVEVIALGRARPRAVAGAILVLTVSIAGLLLAAVSQPFDPTDVVAIGSAFAGAIVSGLAGFAFSAVAGSLMLHWVRPAEAVPLLLACSITTQTMSIASLRQMLDWRRCVPLVLGGILGIPIGAMLLQDIAPRSLAIGFGIFLACYSAYMLARPALRVRLASRLFDVVAGFVGGLTGGSIAFPGAVPTLWYCLQGIPKESQRGAIQPFILIMQIGTLLYFSKLGILTGGTLGVYLWCAPATIVGTWIGLSLFRTVNDMLFRRIVLVFLLISGAVLVI